MPTSEKSPTCAHGTPWAECCAAAGCKRCRANGHSLEAEFQRAVSAGEMCKHGYKPNEAKKAGHRCSATDRVVFISGGMCRR